MLRLTRRGLETESNRPPRQSPTLLGRARGGQLPRATRQRLLRFGLPVSDSAEGPIRGLLSPRSRLVGPLSHQPLYGFYPETAWQEHGSRSPIYSRAIGAEPGGRLLAVLLQGG